MIITNGTKLRANYTGIVSGSLSFSGGTSYLNLNPGIIIGGGSYTVDGYINLPNFNNSYGVFGVAVGDGGSASAMSLYVANSTSIGTNADGGGLTMGYTLPFTLNPNTCYYFALTRDATNRETVFIGTGTTAYQATGATGGSSIVGGVQVNTQNYNNNSAKHIGNYWGNNSYWPGYISNLRITVGYSLYNPLSSTIPIPQGLLTVTTGTVYLMSTTATTVDLSGNQTVTVNGSITTSTQQPFVTNLGKPFIIRN